MSSMRQSTASPQHCRTSQQKQLSQSHTEPATPSQESGKAATTRVNSDISCRRVRLQRSFALAFLGLMSRRPWPASLCRLTSVLNCAVLHTSLESPPADCTREYPSCAHRETTLCVSRESPVHHCLSLKAVLSSRLRDSTTAWSAEAFNTTSVVVVRGKTSCVPSLFLSLALLRGLPHACNRILPYGLLLIVARPPCLACGASTSASTS